MTSVVHLNVMAPFHSPPKLIFVILSLLVSLVGAGLEPLTLGLWGYRSTTVLLPQATMYNSHHCSAWNRCLGVWLAGWWHLPKLLWHLPIQWHHQTLFEGFCSARWTQCYIAFYVRNLRMFVIRQSVPGKHYQPSLMFVGKAKSLYNFCFYSQNNLIFGGAPEMRLTHVASQSQTSIIESQYSQRFWDEMSPFQYRLYHFQ